MTRPSAPGTVIPLDWVWIAPIVRDAWMASIQAIDARIRSAGWRLLDATTEQLRLVEDGATEIFVTIALSIGARAEMALRIEAGQWGWLDEGGVS